MTIRQDAKPSCPICEHQDSWLIPFLAPDTGVLERRSTGYHWRLCKACANAYPLPPPNLSELQALWNRNRIESEGNEITEDVWRLRLEYSRVWAQRSYDCVSPYAHGDKCRFLDVACGLGATVALFQEKGWFAEGVDADPNTQAFHARLNIRSTIGQIENVDISARFDLISIAHAIYFITEPRKFVRKVRSMLEEDGQFLVVLSDLLSVFSSGSPQYAHTWYPTSYSLAYLLQQEGFEVIATKRMRGSIMMLARRCEFVKHLHKGQFYRAFWAHLIHDGLNRLLGRPILKCATIIKKLI